MFNPQLNKHGELQHLLSTEGLPRSIVTHILDQAQGFAQAADRSGMTLPCMSDKRVCLAFDVRSSVARAGFAAAAKYLSADTFDLDDGAIERVPGKPDSLLGRLGNLAGRRADVVILKHPSAGAAHFAVRHVGQQHRIVNAGDGMHADPVEALADVLTILQHKPDFTALCIAIVGDIAHSGAARSLIHVFSTLGVPELRVVAPLTLIPQGVEQLGVRVFTEMRTGLADVDVVIMLAEPNANPFGSRELISHYGLTRDCLSRLGKDAVVLGSDSWPATVAKALHLSAGLVATAKRREALGTAVRMAVIHTLAAIPA
jgi:aspartate carbamoyltransferase catalytic subunit